MSELCLSSTSKTRLFVTLLTLLKSDLFLFFSFILSHPIYFLYLIFFSPYLLKLLSFISPLFITTSLLLLSLLTLSPNLIIQGSFSKESLACSNKVSFLITAFHAVVEKLQSKIDGDCHNEELLCFEDFEVFKIVFDNPMIITHDAKVSPVEILDPSISLDSPVIACSEEVENSGESDNWAEIEMEEKRLEGFLKNLDDFDESFSAVNCSSPTCVEEKEIEVPLGTMFNKEVEKQDKISLVRNGSEADGYIKSQNKNVGEVGSGKGRQLLQNQERVKGNYFDSEEEEGEEEGTSSSLKVESSRALDYMNFGSYGSMRKEKDWKRTLASKLFEERKNGDGSGEGMDLLWETTYEAESSKSKSKSKGHDLKKKKNNKKYEYVEEDEDDEPNVQLCCLQALKFSTRKMNLGMGSRISKAIKGIGWLHNVSSRKHSKKVHNGDRFSFASSYNKSY